MSLMAAKKRVRKTKLYHLLGSIDQDLPAKSAMAQDPIVEIEEPQIVEMTLGKEEIDMALEREGLEMILGREDTKMAPKIEILEKTAERDEIIAIAKGQGVDLRKMIEEINDRGRGLEKIVTEERDREIDKSIEAIEIEGRGYNLSFLVKSTKAKLLRFKTSAFSFLLKILQQDTRKKDWSMLVK